MSGCRRAKSAKSVMSRCVAKGGAKVTAHALVEPEDARLELVRGRFHLVRELEDLLPRCREAIARRQLFEHVRSESLLQLGHAPDHSRMVHPELLRGSPDRTAARDGEKIANVIPVDHGAIRHHTGAFFEAVSGTSCDDISDFFHSSIGSNPHIERHTPIGVGCSTG